MAEGAGHPGQKKGSEPVPHLFDFSSILSSVNSPIITLNICRETIYHSRQHMQPLSLKKLREKETQEG